MPKGAVSQQINNVEAFGVVGLQYEGSLFCESAHPKPFEKNRLCIMFRVEPTTEPKVLQRECTQNG